jgi:hypothetical protein
MQLLTQEFPSWREFLSRIVSQDILSQKFFSLLSLTIDMIPSDSRVEIDAKINAGYFTTGKKYTDEELAQVKGRGWQNWEDVEH